MPNHKKASHHHGKAGDALSKGDLKAAAHHMGHALSALRANAPDDEAAEMGPDDEQAEGETSDVPVPAKGLRGRLASFKKKGEVEA